MKKLILFVMSLAALAAFSSVALGQTPSPTPLSAEKQAKRDATRDKLRILFANLPKEMNISFKQSEKQPYNFVGTLNTGLRNTQFFEIVVGVSNDETIGFRIYPHYHGNYINIDKARNSAALMRQLLGFSNHNFLFWGADDSGDIFAAYTVTLESGFPDEAIKVVLWSVKPLDDYVGQMSVNIDSGGAL